jgi:hypothetical protein
MSKRRALVVTGNHLLMLGLGVLWVGCSSTGALSSFRGMQTPVMLGPQHRVNVSQPAPKGTKVDDWWAETVRHESSQDLGDVRVTTINSSISSYMAERASSYIQDNHKGSADLDLHVTTIQGVAYVTSFGGAAKEYVRVDTDVVKKAEAK